jgi:hypothetical protein
VRVAKTRFASLGHAGCGRVKAWRIHMHAADVNAFPVTARMTMIVSALDWASF